MSNPNQIYNTANSHSASGHARELDLRQELFNTFFGTTSEVAKSSKGLLRRIRYDNKNNPVLCPCVDRVTREQDKDYFCPVCLGERYLFDESFLDFYKVQHADDNALKSKPVGMINVDVAVFYLRYGSAITDYDKIIEINLGIDGNIQYPIKRVNIWRINELVPLRLDHGRLEFYKVFVNHEDVRYLNTP